jgi:hypothetical protein
MTSSTRARRGLPALLALAALALSACGSDTLAQPPLPEPTASSTLLDLPTEEDEVAEEPTDEEVEETSSNVALTQSDAGVVVSAMSQRSAKAESVWVGRKDGKAALKVLEIDVDPTNRVQIAANLLGATFVCVEAKDGSAYTFTTVVGAEDANTVSGETECPSANTALVENLRDHLAADATAAAKEKERRKKQREKDKAEQEAADAEAEAQAEAAEVAERLAAVQTDATGVAGMLTTLLADAPKGPRKPGQPEDIRDIDTVDEVTKSIAANGMTLTEENRIGSVTKTAAGFIVCVESGSAGPSATHNGITGKTVTVEDAGCA